MNKSLNSLVLIRRLLAKKAAVDLRRSMADRSAIEDRLAEIEAERQWIIDRRVDNLNVMQSSSTAQSGALACLFDVCLSDKESACQLEIGRTEKNLSSISKKCADHKLTLAKQLAKACVAEKIINQKRRAEMTRRAFRHFGEVIGNSAQTSVRIPDTLSGNKRHD
ncbi:MAG: hypothetical protein JRJ87_16540 [Deltaproteobacteria bacterium]|nr:hypothetical protein [Deltaproteobacteria bacterium]